MSIAANKVPGVRAALVCDEKMAALARQHNNANVLCLGGKFFDSEHASRIVDAFLDAQFEGGRHERRVQKTRGFFNTTRPQAGGGRSGDRPADRASGSASRKTSS